MKGSDVDFLQRLSSFSEVTTLFLPWIQDSTLDEVSGSDPNLLLREYYAWTASTPLCDVIESPPVYTSYKSHVVYRAPVKLSYV